MLRNAKCRLMLFLKKDKQRSTTIKKIQVLEAVPITKACAPKNLHRVNYGPLASGPWVNKHAVHFIWNIRLRTINNDAFLLGNISNLRNLIFLQESIHDIVVQIPST